MSTTWILSLALIAGSVSAFTAPAVRATARAPQLASRAPQLVPRARVGAVVSTQDDGDEPAGAVAPAADSVPLLFSQPALLSALAAYIGIVFISDLLPGPSALSLDPDTWREAFALSTNFWLILPLSGQGPVLHPGLEAVFNLDLIWAALFAGFLVDGRAQPVPFGRLLLGMQFLTAPVYLSYLALRKPRPAAAPVSAELSAVERATESRALPAVLGVLGLGVLAWGALGRPEFGDLPTRTASLVELLSNDRLGFSFLVDMGIFAVWQGALIGDDLARRAVAPADARRLAMIGGRVPFAGLVYYLLNRPALIGFENGSARAAPAAAVATAVRPPAVRLPWSAPAADSAAPVRAYFDAWNRREMAEATLCASEDVVYEDTLFAGKLVGREALRAHLVKCADALPTSFRFVLDDVAASGELVGTRWHVETADGGQLPFARGASMYKVRGGLIVEGFDVPEPTLKTGAFSLAILSVVSKLGRALGAM
jgi:ketosteroid isomerase-like protein